MSHIAKLGPTAAFVFLPLALTPLRSQEAAAAVAARCSPLDVNGDGTPEIVRLEGLGGVGPLAAQHVLVLVERRLWTERPGVDPARRRELRARVRRFAADLAAEGFRAETVAVECHSGPRHQDGRTLLGLRRYLRAYAAAGPKLAGAVLVGHFPDALLLRTCNWRKRGAIKVRGTDGKPVSFDGKTPYLRRITEAVAHRCDLVLADLDGGWEALYLEALTTRPGAVAVFPDGVPDAGGVPVAREPRPTRFADAFHVADGRVVVDARSGAIEIDDATRDHECTAADRANGNAIARPEIAVSRVDARGVAWSPQARFLDAHGRPRPAGFAPGDRIPQWTSIWRPDPDLELRLLIEYFDRNHAYRTRPRRAEAFKPASIAWGLGSGMRQVRRAAPEWREFAEPGYDVTGNVDLCALTEWLRRPAVFRTVRVHSNPRGASFQRTDVAALEALIGGVPWSWSRRGRALVPSLASACGGGRAEFFLYRTLWENDALPGHPYLLVHTGCEALSPPGWQSVRYDDPRYDKFQHAEAMLFYTPCLVMVGRTKVFYDEPRDFSATLARGGTFGAAWRRYFEVEAGAKTWREVGGDIGRKRAYFWSVLGDWTLRLR